METKAPIRSPLALNILGRAMEKQGIKAKDFELAREGRKAQARAKEEALRRGQPLPPLKS